MIRHTGNKYTIWSMKTHEGHRRRLGEYSSKKEAMNREEQIEYFKHKAEHKGWKK
jgi:hypothetical protein